MSRIGWLGVALAVSVLSGVALAADPAKDTTVEARLRALEKRISDLEQKASESPSAELERRVSALEKKNSAPAAPSTLEQRVSSLEKKESEAPASARSPAAKPAGPPRWQDQKNWSALRIGMTWSQVKQILGVPGKVKAGVFGDVMFFPDDKGGSVEFDRDGRVSGWSQSGAR